VFRLVLRLVLRLVFRLTFMLVLRHLLRLVFKKGLLSFGEHRWPLWSFGGTFRHWGNKGPKCSSNGEEKPKVQRTLVIWGAWLGEELFPVSREPFGAMADLEMDEQRKLELGRDTQPEPKRPRRCVDPTCALHDCPFASLFLFFT
jgi:hypothetical protein